MKVTVAEAIEKFSTINTPFYFYDIELLRRTLDTATHEAGRYGYQVHYALKANYNDRILKEVCSFGLGADCVSGNEVQKAIALGFKPGDIVFAGVGKTDREIEIALKNKIFSINCESVEELEVVAEIAAKMNVVAPVSLRLNPNVNANSHHFISTGLNDNKFGIHRNNIQKAITVLKSSDSLQMKGIHLHIGSQITGMGVFKNLCLKANELLQYFAGQEIAIEHLNIGGGLGINYEDPESEPIADFKKFFSVIHENLKVEKGQKVHFELGRSLVGQCGFLISRVVYVKGGVGKKFLIVDAGMNDLIRPALYGANHFIKNLSAPTGRDHVYDVAGPVCESADFFGKKVRMAEAARNDLIAIYSAGAYGQTMSSNYNLRSKAPSVYSDELNRLNTVAAFEDQTSIVNPS